MRLTLKEQIVNPLQRQAEGQDPNQGIKEFKAEDLTSKVPQVDDLLNAPVPAAKVEAPKEKSSFESLLQEATTSTEFFQIEDKEEVQEGGTCGCW